MTRFDNNKDKVCLFLKDDVGKSRIRLRAKSHDPWSRDHDVTILFFTFVFIFKTYFLSFFLKLIFLLKLFLINNIIYNKTILIKYIKKS